MFYSKGITQNMEVTEVNINQSNAPKRITIDGLALLSDTLDKAGYGEQLAELYDAFEIDTVEELTPEQYKPFADALTRMATESDGEPDEPDDDGGDEPAADDESDTDACLARGDYHGVALNAFYDVIHINRLLFGAISRVHRLEHLTSLKCPDIITTNEAKMARDKLGAIQRALDNADDALRKLQLKTDRRSKEERLLDAIFGGERKGRKYHER